MNELTLARFNSEADGGVSAEDIADRIFHSPTGWPELNGSDRDFAVSDITTWESLVAYESVHRTASGYTIWTCFDGFVLEGYTDDEPNGIDPAYITTVHLPRDLAFGD